LTCASLRPHPSAHPCLHSTVAPEGPSISALFPSLLGGIPSSQLGSILGTPWAACPCPPLGTLGCSSPKLLSASHSLTRAPWLLLPEGGCDGRAHNKDPTETIGEECIRFRTNTVWARTIASDSHPRNTFSVRGRRWLACPGPPTSLSVPETWMRGCLYPTSGLQPQGRQPCSSDTALHPQGWHGRGTVLPSQAIVLFCTTRFLLWQNTHKIDHFNHL
jgi:hypothetical protein